MVFVNYEYRPIKKWIQTLTPFEKKLKAWYQGHGCLISEDNFILNYEALQNADEISSPFDKLDPSKKNYPINGLSSSTKILHMDPAPWFDRTEQFYLQKHPCYFPDMKMRFNEVCFIYMMFGKGTVILEHKEKKTTIRLAEGDLLFLAPNLIATKHITDDASVCIGSGMSRSAFQKILTQSIATGSLADFLSEILTHPGSEGILLYHTSSDTWTQDLFLHALYEYAKDDFSCNQIVTQYMHIIFSHVQTHFPCECALSLQNEKITSMVPSFFTYMQENYRYFSRNDMAAFFHVSPTYISRIFKKYTGKSLSETIRDIRLSTAGNLLLNTDINVNEIAESVGYEDVSYFIEIFRSYFGETPLQYRKKQQ